MAMNLRRPFDRLRGLRRDSRGATAVEYGLIVALIVIAMIAALRHLAERNTAIWNNVNDQVRHAS